jgi:hypothetical protein
VRQLVYVGLIWLGCAVAWMILGSTLLVRSGETTGRLGPEVQGLWGPPLEQLPPVGSVPKAPVVPAPNPAAAAGAPYRSDPPPNVPTGNLAIELLVPLVGSDIDVGLALEHRQKGLLWFATYGLSFDARYTFENPSDAEQKVLFELPLAESNALYDGFTVTRVDGRAVSAEVQGGVARWNDTLKAHEKPQYRVKYRSRGTGSWTYAVTRGTTQVRDFRLGLTTDFGDVDFPAGSLSPSSGAKSGNSWKGEWRFETLVASAPIGVEMPQLLNPGPLASKITFFAPLSLLFFFFVVAVLAAAQKKELHPLHYFFLGTAFFAFHLLFAYLVDHFAIVPSFVISSLVAVTLVVSYSRLFVGWKFALREMAASQLIYLVLFSLTFFWNGFTGLSITVGAIITLFVLMQLTGRKNPFAQRPDDEEEQAKPACAAPYRCGVFPNTTPNPSP